MLAGQEFARVSGENIIFGKKCRAESMMDSVMVNDPNLVKQYDAEGQVLWVLGLAHRKDLQIEEVGQENPKNEKEKVDGEIEARTDTPKESTKEDRETRHRAKTG